MTDHGHAMNRSPISVLLFENDESHALQAKAALEPHGVVVDICPTGREGLKRLSTRQYDAHLIDMSLPDIHGIEVLKRINAFRPGAVSIVVTSPGNELAAIEALKLGACDYVVKSATMGHLAALPVVIREGLERRHLKDQREQLQTELWEHARLLEERNAELRRANEELKRLNQLKTELVSTVSHELRTPLTTVKEFTAILQDGLAGPTTPGQLEYLEIIRANVERMVRIIDELLDMAKLETRRTVLEKRAVEVRPLVEQAAESLRTLAESKQVRIELRLPEPPLKIFADQDKVGQVLTNLMTNAVKATAGPGRVSVAVEDQVDDVQFSVMDEGIRMAPEELSRLFQPHPPATGPAGPSASTTASDGGRHLGTALSRRLVELHGGRIWAENRDTSGVRVCFTLPKYHVEEVFKEYLRTGVTQAKQRRAHFSVVMATVEELAALKARVQPEELTRFLKEVEEQVQSTIRWSAGDVMVRCRHGELFVVLAPMDKSGCQAMAGRIKRVVEQRLYRVAGEDRQIAVRASSATYPDDGMEEEELIRVAEVGLRAASPPDPTPQ